MPDDFDKILDEAEDLTSKQLDSRISSLTKLTDKELSSLFPKAPDKERLLKLMQIVKGATKENEKQQQLIDNIESLAGTVIKLLGKVV
ncbi:MAG: hypothetical protein EPO24_04015 [Bacteroidetes bacterium]|nr:MAG: hypothetical protein EPO24_04015 [Bacteroidota bacterium]